MRGSRAVVLLLAAIVVFSVAITALIYTVFRHAAPTRYEIAEGMDSAQAATTLGLPVPPGASSEITTEATLNFQVAQTPEAVIAFYRHAYPDAAWDGQTLQQVDGPVTYRIVATRGGSGTEISITLAPNH